MARIPMGKRTLIKTLMKIMEDPTSTKDQVLKACDILRDVIQKPKRVPKALKREKMVKKTIQLLGK